MDAQLIGAKGLGYGKVAGKGALKFGQVADIIDPLLKLADVAWGQADPLHPQATQLADDVDVLGQGGHRLRLVHAHFQLKRARPYHPGQMAVHHGGMGHRPAVFGRRP